MECDHWHIIYGKRTFAYQMPRAVPVILCQLSLYMYVGTFYLTYKNGYVSATVYSGICTVGIRARFGWENFVEQVSFG